MKGLTFSNELIARDEGLHRDFAIMLHHDKLVNKYRQNDSPNHLKQWTSKRNSSETTSFSSEWCPKDVRVHKSS